MAGNKDCKDVKHVFHICALRACGINEKNDGVFDQLIKAPQFRCEKCGDKANKAENLCKPQKLQA
jgi:hypothetical protein